MIVSIPVAFAVIWVVGFLWSLKVSRLQKLARLARAAQARQQREAETRACERAALLNYARAGVGVGEAMMRLGLVPATPEELAQAYCAYQREQMRELAQSPHLIALPPVVMVWRNEGGQA